MIQQGDQIPNFPLRFSEISDNDDASSCGLPQQMTTHELFAGKKVVLFAVPGAFTPTCQNAHITGFIDKADAIKDKGVDLLACVATNDVFVMYAWGRHLKVGNKIVMLSDGNGDFVTDIGLSLDLTKASMGSRRSARFAMIINNLVVEYLGVENSGGVTVSGADAVLAKL